MSGHNAYRDGKVHVCRQLCETCVFRAGNLMHLEPGRLATMAAEATANESAIICHSSLYREGVDNAVCRGFCDRHRTQPLQIAQRLDLVEFDGTSRAEANQTPGRETS